MAEHTNLNTDTKMPFRGRHFYDNRNRDTGGRESGNRGSGRGYPPRDDRRNGPNNRGQRPQPRYGLSNYMFVDNDGNDEAKPPKIIHHGNDDLTDSPDTNSEYADPQIKLQLLSYLYRKLDVSRYKYRLLEFEKDLEQLKNTKFVSPNYNGINSLLVFTKLKDKFYSFTVDRRTLRYNLKQIDLSTIKLLPINIRLDESIYDGTVIDGVILYNNPNKDRRKKKIYVINDIYMFQGNLCSAEIMTNKILNINAYLNHNYKKDNQFNNVEFIVNTFYELKDMGHLVNTNIPKSTYRNSIKGIAFFPERSGTKLIYLYSNCTDMKKDLTVADNDIKSTSPKEKVEIRKPKIIAPTEAIEAVFRMKQTEVVDVYSLYLSKIIEKDDKKFVKYVKYGIAYIQTVECSYFCKDLFKSEGKDVVLVKCKYIPDKNKWVPFVQAIDKKLPDNYDDVHKHFQEDNN